MSEWRDKIHRISSWVCLFNESQHDANLGACNEEGFWSLGLLQQEGCDTVRCRVVWTVDERRLWLWGWWVAETSVTDGCLACAVCLELVHGVCRWSDVNVTYLV
jgi:hypothetical protein